MILCLGFGYVASNLVKAIDSQFIGTHREDDLLQILQANSKSISKILISIPPVNESDLVYNTLVDEIKKLPKLEWVGYLSATSVYQNNPDAWIDESGTTLQNFPRKKAEDLWLCSNLPIHIFRLSAIYGKGRSVIEQILEQRARRIHKENQFFSRIHVADIVQVLLASINNPKPGEIYNLADDYPCGHAKIVEYGCDLLKYPYPELEDFATASISEQMRSFYLNSRQISNKKIKDMLGIRLKFPSYKEGLEAIVKEYNK